MDRKRSGSIEIIDEKDIKDETIFPTYERKMNEFKEQKDLKIIVEEKKEEKVEEKDKNTFLGNLFGK